MAPRSGPGGGTRAPRAVRQAMGPHLLVRNDCLRELRRMEADSVDVVVTSPPYNIGLGYRTYRDRMSEDQYLDWMMAVARELHRVMRPDGSFFLNIAGSSAQPWLPFELAVRLREIFHLQNHISWIKSISVHDDTYGHFKPVNSARYLHRNHEHLFHLTRSGTVELRRLDIGVPYKDKSNIARRGHEQDRRCRGDTWFIPYETVRDKAQKFNHPGTFPVQLPRQCIRLHGRPDAVVLDPFMGTGTTLVAAQMESARGVGIELDAAYVKVARERLKLAMEQDEISA
ncbi:site-specific DNA-methyltransferase [Gluconacetobacter sp. 1b LMG 1731]|uniref:Methyltransferase n=1 Tax=Gluconacetobacter dulcium TaxID=2729096 RepID=A0A7W4K1F8_9PROT|nr:site-specific DNA-methyltransferase [Gluconacetobacter dulcium]MBB2165745.1 site-specific DNA-methyltransferase [Gluconacetobacter dulcium]MBB2194830.1 site-specific DNA-methyltransferase [Gluconacetobacter dulcium]MBB2198631.1 site-specific DNA-methyltransferase [Gluconacetobacter dulcium]